MRKRALLFFLATYGLLQPNLLHEALAAESASVSREYQIKAAFLYNFTKFVEWPPRRFAAPESPIVIGILGDNPFGDELATIVKSRKVNNRPIEIRFVTTAAEAASVHVLFAVAGQESRMAAMSGPLKAQSVLTVGESPSFAASGGMIDFIVEGDKVRFAINAELGEQAGLKFSAQLLKLATAVHSKEGPIPCIYSEIFL
jgi:hypothetical protein